MCRTSLLSATCRASLALPLPPPAGDRLPRTRSGNAVAQRRREGARGRTRLIECRPIRVDLAEPHIEHAGELPEELRGFDAALFDRRELLRGHSDRPREARLRELRGLPRALERLSINHAGLVWLLLVDYTGPGAHHRERASLSPCRREP